MSHRKFLLFYAVAAVTVLGCIAGINALIGQFPHASESIYERGIAEAWMRGFNIIQPGPYEERLVMRYVAERQGPSQGLAVFGSSRTRQVSREMFPGEAFFNYSVSGAEMEDIVALLQIRVEKGGVPPKIVFCVDPWWFCGTGRGFQVVNQDYFQKAEVALKLNLAENDPADLSTNRKILSWVQKWTGLTPLFRLLDVLLIKMAPAQALTQDTETDFLLIRSDGSMRPEKLTRMRTPAQVREKVLGVLLERKNRQGFGTCGPTVPARVEFFRRWMENLQGQGCRIVFFLGPYHPAAYPRLIQIQDNVLVETEREVRRIAKQLNIPVAGSYEPGRAGVDETDFEDVNHMHEKGLFKVLGGGTPSTRAP